MPHGRAVSTVLMSVLLVAVVSAHGPSEGVADVAVGPSGPGSPQCTDSPDQDVRAADRTATRVGETRTTDATDGRLHVAVAIIPERGHLSSVRELVLTLARRGHRVTFMSLEACLRDDESGCAETVGGWAAQHLSHANITVRLASSHAAAAEGEAMVHTSALAAELNAACHAQSAGDTDLRRTLRVAEVMLTEGFRMYARMLPVLLERCEADRPSLVVTDTSTFAGLDLAAFLRLPLVVHSPTPILADATVPHGLLVPTFSVNSRRLTSLRTLRGRLENLVEHASVWAGFAFMHREGMAVKRQLGMRCGGEGLPGWLRWLHDAVPHPFHRCSWGPQHPTRAPLGWDFPGHAHMESNGAVAQAWVLQGAVIGSLESPRLLEPRYHQVGPMFLPLPPAASLPTDKDPFGVMQWIADCETPVVYISFGTVVDLHATQTARILSALQQLPGVCALWSLREQAWSSLPTDRHDLGARLKLVPFAPQQHVLAHPNVMAFVTHCGQNSLNEAFMQSKPVVGLPVFADQLVLCARVADTGAGLCLTPLTSAWTAAQLSDAVLTILNDPLPFAAAADRHRRLMRAAGGATRAADVVELAAAVPQGTLVPPHARYGELQLPWWARHHLDVVGVAALLTTVLCLALRSAARALLDVVLSSSSLCNTHRRPVPSPAACDEHPTTTCRTIPEEEPVLVWPSDE